MVKINLPFGLNYDNFCTIMSEFIKGIPPEEFKIIPPANPESNGHAEIVNIADLKKGRQRRQWNVLTTVASRSILILSLGAAAGLVAAEVCNVMVVALDSIPPEMGYSQPLSKLQPTSPDIIKFSLRSP